MRKTILVHKDNITKFENKKFNIISKELSWYKDIYEYVIEYDETNN